jgi:hypothetical protein
MNKEELLEKVKTSRTNLDLALLKISEDRMTSKVLHGEWSVKDLIGHLAFWENRAAALYDMLSKGETPAPVQDIDKLNAQAVSEMNSVSLEKIRLLETKAYMKILKVIEDASEPELFDQHHFPWTQGRSFQEIIADNTWNHYDEHLLELTAWQKRIA